MSKSTISPMFPIFGSRNFARAIRFLGKHPGLVHILGHNLAKMPGNISVLEKAFGLSVSLKKLLGTCGYQSVARDIIKVISGIYVSKSTLSTPVNDFNVVSWDRSKRTYENFVAYLKKEDFRPASFLEFAVWESKVSKDYRETVLCACLLAGILLPICRSYQPDPMGSGQSDKYLGLFAETESEHPHPVNILVIKA